MQVYHLRAQHVSKLRQNIRIHQANGKLNLYNVQSQDAYNNIPALAAYSISSQH